MHEILELSGEQLAPSQKSYLAIEIDNFGFENFIFSIVNAKQVHQHEHKIFYLDNWFTRMRKKPTISTAQTKMEEFISFTRNNTTKVTGGSFHRKRGPPSTMTSAVNPKKKRNKLTKSN